ncbi:MAG: tetratricopeptide repeat protein [Ignavibacteriaceae bacterium]
MKNLKMMLSVFAAALFISGLQFSYSQSLRGLVNDGVDKYHKGDFADAEVNFKKGTEKSPENFESKFNLGDALFKQQRYDEAIKSYESALPLAENNLDKAKVHYNVGNSLLKSKKIKESIEEYKKSLKLNPDDQETKYNLSYALSQLKNQNNQKKQNDQNQKNDKNKDQKQNQQNKQQQQQQKNQEAKQDNTKQQQQQPKISKQEAQRILNALKDNEKELQKKLRKIKGRRVKTDKDW